MFATLALLAVCVEAIFGYPQRVMQWFGHPVMWIGSLIAWCDKQWNNATWTPSRRHIAGALTLCFCLSAALALTIALAWALTLFAPNILQVIVLAVLASTLIAQKSLHDHVRDVAERLETQGISEARTALSKIVGRETRALEEPAVCRAAIESLAENFSDGVVAPVFWLTLAGLPGMAAYKTINTADSMIGHLTQKYKDFGWAAARMDDIVNWPAARLSVLFLVIAAALTPNANASHAARCALRDASKHRSPNAGWPEAAMAGALNLKLAGPRIYNGQIVDDHWLGDGRETATAADIRAALSLYTKACWIETATLGLLAAVTLI